MEIIRTLTPAETTSAVALGSFDGIHLGHREVISRALAAESRGLTPTVFTFTENPKVGKDSFGGLLLTQEEKIRTLSEMGVKRLYLVEFESIRSVLPEDFVSGILADVCRAKLVCCGFNFTFGKGGRAGSNELRSLCAAQGIETSVAEPVSAEGGPVSSTRIRNLLADGKPEEAARLLGRPFAYESPVVTGRRLGRELGTPTLNQAVPSELVRPKFGVYVSAVSFGDTITFGVTNVGVKPTVGSDALLAETWMPAYHGPELYGKTVRTALLKFLRPEMKFGSLEELKAAIRHNGEQAEFFFREHPELFDSRR